MSGSDKNDSGAPSAAANLQVGGAAEGWSRHSGHLSPDDFSEEKPAVEPPVSGSVPPVTATQPPWATGVPGSQAPTVAPGTMTPQPGRSAMLPWVVIGALLILVLILVSALNLRDYHLIQAGDHVEVRRGGWLPGTTRAISADSILLKRRYAPLKLESGMQYRPRRFTEREDLDAGLIQLVVELLGPALNRGDEPRVEQLGVRLERFPSATSVLEGKHQKLLRRVGLIRGRLAEAEVINAVARARELYRRYHRHASVEVTRALERLDAVQRLLSERVRTPERLPLKPASDGSGTEF
jgi:hypothetical protein